MLLNSKNYTINSNVSLSRYQFNETSNINFPQNFRIDTGLNDKPSLNSSKGVIFLSRKINWKLSKKKRNKLSTSTNFKYITQLVQNLKYTTSVRVPRLVGKEYLRLQQLQKQAYQRVSLSELNRNVRHKTTTIGFDEANTTTLVSFWKQTYPHALRIIDSTNNPILVKKSSKLLKPVRRVFLRLKFLDKKYPLLNKSLLYAKTNNFYTSPENEIGFFSKSKNVLTPLFNKTSVYNLSWIQFVLASSWIPTNSPELRQVYKLARSSYSPLWSNLVSKFLRYAEINSTLTSFFYKNLNLTGMLSSTFSQKLFYQNHFFTLNRSAYSELTLQAYKSQQNSPLNLSKVRLVGKVRTNVKTLKLSKLPSLYRNYFLFIELSKQISQWSNRRPIYSHLFSRSSLYKRFLITITTSSKVVPYWKSIKGNKQKISPTLSGLFLSFFNKDNDNFFENTFDRSLLHLLLSSKQPLFNQISTHLYSTLLTYLPEKLYLTPSSLTRNPNLQPTTPLTVKNSTELNSFTSFFGQNSNYLLTSSTNNVPAIFTNPLLFKFIFWNVDNNAAHFQKTTLPFLLKNNFKNNPLMITNPLLKSNLLPLTFFKYTIRRKVIKLVVSSKYLPRTTTYFYRSLIQFMEFFTGKKVYLKFNPFIENSLTYSDLARCYMWFGRVNPYQRILGHKIFVHESLRIFHLALRFKDPTFLSNWIKAMLYRMSFWKYRILFRYIKYVLRNLFWAHFDELNFKGIKLTLRGKISVAGNARTRTLTFSVGKTSHSEMNNKVLSNFTNIHSFTGVMGFRLSFYF